MVENAVIESLKTRRAVRGYADRPVEREKLDAILEAATCAYGNGSPVARDRAGGKQGGQGQGGRPPRRGDGT